LERQFGLRNWKSEETLFLLMTSQSNYPPREIFWDNVRAE